MIAQLFGLFSLRRECVQYPLTMSFKILALAPQIKVTDVNGDVVCYVKQKMFKLKEAVNVFQDASQQQLLCEIKADRIIDWSANYHFYDTSGESFGSVRRKGMRSIWRAHYETFNEDGQHESTISELNPMAKVADSVLGELPIVGMFSGYLFHPKYQLTDLSNQPRMTLAKQPAMWEGKFLIEKMYDYDDVAELRDLMSLLMMTLLERARG